MFKLVALLFLVTHGVQAEKPSGRIINQQTFATEEACNGYLATERGADAKSMLEKIIADGKGAVVAEIQCIKADAKTEDNSI